MEEVRDTGQFIPVAHEVFIRLSLGILHHGINFQEAFHDLLFGSLKMQVQLSLPPFQSIEAEFGHSPFENLVD